MLAREKVPKIDVDSMKQINAEVFHEFRADEVASYIDSMKMFQSLFLKRLPPAIANGMTNFMYVSAHPNATTKDFENFVVKYC